MAKERSETENKTSLDSLDVLAERHVELKTLRTSMEKALTATKELMVKDDERIDGHMAKFATIAAEQEQRNNQERAAIATLWRYVLLNEKEANGREIIDMETSFDLVYDTVCMVFELNDAIENKLTNLMSKEEAHGFLKQETTNFSKNLLRAINRREEQAKRRWIRDKFGQK